MEDTVVAFDLGTTRSCAAIMGHGMPKPEILSNSSGHKLIPSVVQFRENGQCIVGDAALKRVQSYPTTTFYDFKRLIGKKICDEYVNEDIFNWPFKVVDDDGCPLYQFDFAGEGITKHSPQFLSALVLQELKRTAEARLQKELKKVVITVPARFSQYQRTATLDAAKIIGLEASLLAEPTAAALAVGLHTSLPRDAKILVFDLGGGTFDVNIMNITPEGFNTLGTDGDDHLGCKDFDRALFDHYVEKHERENVVKLNTKTRAKLRLSIQEARETLSNPNETDVTIDEDTDEGSIKWHITRAEFETLCSDLFKRTERPINRALSTAGIKTHEISTIVLMGGGSRMYKIGSMLKEMFPDSHILDSITISADEGVAIGGAIYASLGTTFSNGIIFTDAVSHSLGIEYDDPERGEKGIGLMERIILKDDSLPAAGTSTELTADKEGVTINVYEGEGKYVKFNTLLGSFVLKNNSGVKKEMVCDFRLEDNGLLIVTAGLANDRSSFKTMKIEGDRGAMPEEEIYFARQALAAHNQRQADLASFAKLKGKLTNAISLKRKSIEDEPDTERREEKRAKLNEVSDWLKTASVNDGVLAEEKLELIGKF